MKKRRSFLPILILSVLMVLIACLTACDSTGGGNGDETGGDHTHSFSAWTTTSTPSCSTPGMQTRTCSCGFAEYSQIAALGHTPVTDEAVAPTCTESGKTEGSHCSVCNTTITNQETLQALQHACDDVSIIENATCIKNGTKRFTCTRDNCNYYYDETFPLQEYSSTEIYNQALKYTGEILTYDKKGLPLAQGTGFVCSADGRIITNYHVIDGAYSATITIGEDTYTIQSVLAYDADIDLAVLKINATGLTPANVCKNDPVTAETVYAVGSPRGFTATVSVGVVSYAKRVVNGVTYVQHDADITHGSSGGPLINKYGEVIGVNAGAFGNAEINVAVFTGELDNLTYGTPLTMAELYELNYTANDILTEWLLGNYNYITDDLIYRQVEGDGFIYAVGYDATEDCNFVEGIWTFDDGSDLYISIGLDANEGLYTYYAHYTYGENENYTHGNINPTTYTASTLLTHYSYVGEYWDETSLMEFYSSAVACAMEWFNYCLEAYVDDLSLADFDFAALEYTYDSTAITKLKTNLRLNGTYDSSSKWYEVEETYEYTNYDVTMSLTYNADNETVFASMGWFGSEGAYYFAYLSLTPSALGNYYGCSYSIYSNGSFVKQNDTNGYIDAGTFTTQTSLKYLSYEGLAGSEADLLAIYASCLQDLLNWIGAYIDSEELGITLPDLGFVFYDGYVPVEDCDGDNHYYQSPTFTWVEDENGFNVTATFVCGCGSYSDTATTYVSNTDYSVTTNATETELTYAFTASVVFDGYTYTDTRYIKYEWQTVTLNNSNYKDYIGVGCSNTSYLVSTSVSKKDENLTYTNVSVTFTVRMTGTANNGAGGMGYSKTETIESGFGQKTTNVSSIGLSGYIFYPSTLTYSVAVSGQVSGYFMTEYLVQ